MEIINNILDNLNKIEIEINKLFDDHKISFEVYRRLSVYFSKRIFDQIIKGNCPADYLIEKFEQECSNIDYIWDNYPDVIKSNADLGSALENYAKCINTLHTIYDLVR